MTRLAFLIPLFLIIALSCEERDNGIVILPGYGEAVAMCDGGEDTEPKPLHGSWFQKEKGIQYKKNGILMVINGGHENNPKNQELFKFAKEHCAKYLTTK